MYSAVVLLALAGCAAASVIGINPNALNVPLDTATVALAKNAQLVQQAAEGTRNILGGGIPAALPADTHEVAAGKVAHAIAVERQRAAVAGASIIGGVPAIATAPAGIIAANGLVGAGLVGTGLVGSGLVASHNGLVATNAGLVGAGLVGSGLVAANNGLVATNAGLVGAGLIGSGLVAANNGLVATNAGLVGAGLLGNGLVATNGLVAANGLVGAGLVGAGPLRLGLSAHY